MVCEEAAHESGNWQLGFSRKRSMAASDDRARLRHTAVAIGDLKNRVVFVGGSVTSLLITDPGAPPTRGTLDVDAVVQATKRAEYYVVEEHLRLRGFSQRSDEPICRWFLDDLIVDVMPDNEEVLGFSNRWYSGAFEHATTTDLDGIEVRLITAVWFLATKLEAFANRGRGDYQGSRDMEDIIAVLDGRESIMREAAAAPENVLHFLADSSRRFLSDEDFRESVPGHLGGDTDRAETVLQRLETLALLGSPP
jgi:hypothetical protein